MASDDYRVDYSEISRVYRMERKDALTEISSDFYGKAREYIHTLENAEREAAGASREMLHNAQVQIRDARKLLSNIWEFRTRKLALIAVSQRRAAAFQPKGLASEEQAFLDEMLADIREHERSSLSGGASTEPAPPRVVREAEGVQQGAAEVKVEKAETAKRSEATKPAGKLVLVRFTANAPKFATEFGEFELMKDDVAFLPEAYSRVLIDRKVAVPVESVAHDRR